MEDIMTVLTRTPENTNFLQPTKFLLTFERIPNVTYFCQEVNLPGLSVQNIPVNTPMLDYHVAGTKITFGALNIRFMVDEKLDSWKNIYNWMQSLGSPKGFDVRNRLAALQNANSESKFTSYSDAVLTILNNLNNPSMRVHFASLFPVSLSDIQFDTTQSADHIITADATFIVEYFDFEEV